MNLTPFQANSYTTKPSRLANVDRGGGYDHSDSFIDDTEAVSIST